MIVSGFCEDLVFQVCCIELKECLAVDSGENGRTCRSYKGRGLTFELLISCGTKVAYNCIIPCLKPLMFEDKEPVPPVSESIGKSFAPPPRLSVLIPGEMHTSHAQMRLYNDVICAWAVSTPGLATK